MAEQEVHPLLSEAAVAARVEALAGEIAATLPAEFTLIALLKGAFVFAADLVRALDRHRCRPRVEFMRVSSYGAGTQSSGTVNVLGEPSAGALERPVLLVDDIQDTGRTLHFTRDFLHARGVARVWTCALLDKPARREIGGDCDFTGFVIEDLFVVGYGIDWAERYRHLPFIGHIA